MIPDSQQAIKFVLSIHNILFICDVSSEIIVRCSFGGQVEAPLTLVPPPNGMQTDPCWAHSLIILTTSSWHSGNISQNRVMISY